MSEDLTHELAAIWTQLRAAIARIDQLEATNTRIERVATELAAEKEKPWEPWLPEIGERYWLVQANGDIQWAFWGARDWDARLRDFNNCRPSGKAAERHALRLRSMRPTCPVPKVGDTVWFVSISESSGAIKGYWEWWEGTPRQIWNRNSGRQFATEDALNAWIAEFGEAWTTLEDDLS